MKPMYCSQLLPVTYMALLSFSNFETTKIIIFDGGGGGGGRGGAPIFVRNPEVSTTLITYFML